MNPQNEYAALMAIGTPDSPDDVPEEFHTEQQEA